MKAMWFQFGAVFAWLSLGCGSHPVSSSDRSISAAATIVSCTADGDCQGDTFCDGGECVAIERTYGSECVIPEADPATGKPRAADYMCGAYVCSEGRCRSCVSNEQCADILGSPTCGVVAGWPGRRCGDYSVDEPSTPADPPPSMSTPPND